MKTEIQYTEKGYKIIAGVDEAGRGPIAGPVVAGACILPLDFNHPLITDSKKITEKKRDEYFDIIKSEALSWAVGIIEPKEIDEINILQATHKAMRLAIEGLNVLPDIALVDGLPVKGLPCEHNAIVKGDALVKSISCASILAKVTRDRIMIELGEKYPEYNFQKHKGYGTKEHIEAIKKHGPCPAHRLTFEPIRSMESTLYLF